MSLVAGKITGAYREIYLSYSLKQSAVKGDNTWLQIPVESGKSYY